MTSTLPYDTHTHTPLCKHAEGEPEAYAEAALRRGMKGIFVTCHNPMPDGWSSNLRMAPEEFGDYLALVARAKHAMAGRFEVRLGLECDYFPGAEPWLEKQIASAPLEYVLGSVHSHISPYKQAFFRGDIQAYRALYFDHLARAAESKLFDCLAHPDLVKNQEHETWKPETVLDDIRRALDRIAKTGVAMEVNTSGLNKFCAEIFPGPLVLKEIGARGIPVTVGSDAHKPERVGADFDVALKALAAAGFESVSYFFERRRVECRINPGAITA